MITLTPSALQFLQNNLNDSPKDTLGIRIGLRDAGCSGFAYTVDFAKHKDEADQIFNFENLQIFIDSKFMQAIQGTEIDYVVDGINSLLKFNNPNVVNSCGCGESFQFKETSA